MERPRPSCHRPPTDAASPSSGKGHRDENFPVASILLKPGHRAPVMAERGLDPVHAHEMLDAFVRDISVPRYAGWDDLIGYCARSAMPVGRYVLDIHGESRAIWPQSDALCAALQVINHLQDCAKDHRTLDRGYIPHEALAAHGARVEDLAADIRDRRLAAEVAVIHRFATSLDERLKHRDPGDLRPRLRRMPRRSPSDPGTETTTPFGRRRNALRTIAG